MRIASDLWNIDRAGTRGHLHLLSKIFQPDSKFSAIGAMPCRVMKTINWKSVRFLGRTNRS
jgi:hypothetical protein